MRSPTPSKCLWPWHELAIGERFYIAHEDRDVVSSCAAYQKRHYGKRFRVSAKRGQPAFVERVA